jgi:Thioredoxin
MQVAAVLVLGAAVAVVLVAAGGDSQAAFRARVGRDVRSLLAGIPEQGDVLGRPSAPVTLVFYGDLECLTTKAWVIEELNPIIRRYVLPGKLKIEFRAFKTDTHDPREFMAQQTSALAAGAQDRLWPFIETFYFEQQREYTPYVTEEFLKGIARQVPGLDLARWHRDREGGRRSEHVAEEDLSAKAHGFHDTPAFLLGPTGGALKDFSGRRIVEFRYGEHPVSVIDTQDIATALKRMEAEGVLARPRTGASNA